MKRIIGIIAAVLLGATVLAGCTGESDTVDANISKDADNFKIERRVVFFNGITDKYLLVIEGRCALGNHDSPKQVSVICKRGKGKYVKHYLGLSDNVSYFAEQTKASKTNAYRYKVTFRPETIVPDIDLRTSGDQQSPDEEPKE